jgi:hypothetical protein
MTRTGALGARAREAAEDTFSVEQIAHAYLEIYRAAAA